MSDADSIDINEILISWFFTYSSSILAGFLGDLTQNAGRLLDPLGLFHKRENGNSASAHSDSLATNFNLGPIGFGGSFSHADASANSNSGVGSASATAESKANSFGGSGASAQASANANAGAGGQGMIATVPRNSILNLQKNVRYSIMNQF